MELKTGERITIKSYNDLPHNHKNTGTARVCGKSGEIIDILTSMSGEKLYIVHLDDYAIPSKHLWSADCFKAESATEYKWDFEVLDNVVVGVMYAVKGDLKTEIVRGHGHIIHEGALGIAQAASYALKKAYEKLGGTF